MCDCANGLTRIDGVCTLACPEGERSLEIGGTGGTFRCVPNECGAGQVRDSLGECVAASSLLCPAREVEVRDNDGVAVTLSLSLDPHPSESCLSNFEARISDLADANCGTCQPRNSCGGNNVNYRTADGDYCGPVSQCNAANGNRIVFGRGFANMTCDGECTDSSHLRFGNGTPELRDDLCAAPITTCAETEVPNDSNNGCIPRAPEHCPDGEEFEADAGGGGRCVQCTGGRESAGGAACMCPNGEGVFRNTDMCEEILDQSDCSAFEEYDSGTNMCDPRTAANCPDDEEFAQAPGGAAGGACHQCPPRSTSTGGAACACPEGERRFMGVMQADRSDDFCAAAVSCTGGSINEMNECICGSGEVIVGGACLPNEDAASCEDYEKFANADSGTGGACLPQVAGDCAAIANQMFVPEIENGVEIGGVCECDALYVRDADDNACRFPEENAECVIANPSEPIHDENEADNCRAAENIDDCETGQVFNAVCEAPDTGQECEDAKDTNYVGIDQTGTCVSSCTSPNVLNSAKVCGPPASDAECATLYGGTRPKHDSSATGNCRAQTDAECAPQVSDATIAGNCRDRAVSDCPNDNDYLNNSMECAAAMTGQQCRDAKNPVAPEAVYESEGNAGCVAANACAEDRQPNAEHTCAPPSEEHCRMTNEVADGNSCRAPQDGAECATSTGDATRNVYDDSFTDAADRCRTSCSPSRELRMDNRCTDRETADCASGLYLDVNDDRMCRQPMTGEECEQRNGGMPGDLLDNAVCRTAAEGCSGDRVADTNGVCQNPTQADCLMQTDGRTYLPTGAVACRAPANGTECAGVDSATGFYDSETSSCVAGCTSSQETRMNNVCENRELMDCPGNQYLDEADDRTCKTPTQVSQCSQVNTPIPNAVFEDNACAENCRTGTDRQAVNSVCMPPSEAHCQMTQEVVDGDSCVAPRNGAECRTARRDTSFYDPAAVPPECVGSCGDGRIGPAPDFNCRDLVATDCTTEPNRYFDSTGSAPECRAPATGTECRMRQGADAGSTEVYESQGGAGCQASCAGNRVASSDNNHTCEALGQSTCTAGLFYDSDDDECRAPASGDECSTAQVGDVYDDSFTDEADRCRTACSASRERRTGTGMNNCTDRETADCAANLYLDEASANRMCRTPMTGTECAERNGGTAGDLRDGNVCVPAADGCSGDRQLDGENTCQDPTQEYCSGLTDGRTFLPAGSITCRVPANGEECVTARGNDATMNFRDTNYPSSCGTECSPSRVARTADNICVDRERQDCANDNEYVDETSANRDCVTPTDVSQCSLVKDPIENAVFEDDACAESCNDDRQAVNSVCQEPSDAHCLLMQLVADGNSCVEPRNGNECIFTTAGNVYDDSFPVGERCQTACSASREQRTDMNNDCTDRTLDDCNDNQYLDTADNRTCKAPTQVSQCEELKIPIQNAVFEGGACRPMALSDCENGQFLDATDMMCKTPDTGAECRLERQGETRDQTLVYESEAAGGADCVSSCTGNRVQNAEFTCQDPTGLVCAEENQAPNADGDMCDCISGYADSDTSAPGLTCTRTPMCDTQNNQFLDTTRNRCDCVNMFEDIDATTPLECVRVCVDPEERQPDGSCAAPTTGRTLADCADTQKLSSGECEDLTEDDCTPLEKFENGRCVLLTAADCSPGACASLSPYDGAYTADTCTNASWPWSIVQTADGLSELCHAPVNLLATEVPSSQTLNNAGEQLDFCVLRGAASGDSVRCDDPTLFGNLGIPPAPAGLVAQITTAITITLADGATREAATLTAEVDRYLQAVHSSGSVVAVFPPETTEAEITTARPLVGTISLEVSVSMAPPATNTMTPPPATNTMTPPAASGGGGGGGGGAAAALIAVPVVLLGGYWLLGGFDYIDPTYNLDYSGENDTLSYRGDAGFDLNHGNLNSYVRAIQSNGDAVSYESGISYGADFYSLNYAAYESHSEYAYDLSANLNYGDGPWSISPTADAEFHYSADSEDWTSTAGARLTADWTSHKWNIRAHSAFAGDLNHGLDLEFRF